VDERSGFDAAARAGGRRAARARASEVDAVWPFGPRSGRPRAESSRREEGPDMLTDVMAEVTTREALIEKIKAVKRAKSLSWRKIAEAAGGASPVLVTAALLGQMKLTESEASRVGALLDLSPTEVLLLTEVPYRGSLPALPPTDPLIYRFYELVQVYGTTLKALIEEEFGDGIMSAIDLDMALERQPDPKGDRVKVTLSGKFLPYKRY
jgi:cyanate lyase